MIFVRRLLQNCRWVLGEGKAFWKIKSDIFLLMFFHVGKMQPLTPPPDVPLSRTAGIVGVVVSATPLVPAWVY
jgi:hypothetical protein